ncbi:MAG: phosphodiester glycosidase family protein, partial [Verrucomicrobiota bacterium]
AVAVSVSAHGEWTTLSASSDAGPSGVVHRHVALRNAQGEERVDVDLALFSAKSCALRIIQNESGNNALAEVMQSEKCLAGVNGGYFNPEFAPIGLRIINGQIVTPLVRARLLTGLLVSSSRGVQILRIREFSIRSKVDSAVECGPFLVELGQPIRGLDNTRAARRTFAVTASPDRVALGFCSEVSLAGLSQILSTARLADDFKVQRALNLDGGSSSAFWVARNDGAPISISEQKSVRDFIGMIPRR